LIRVRVLLTTYYEGVMYRPGAVLELDPREFTDQAGVVQLPRWAVEDRDHYPASSPKRSAGFGWVTYDPA